MGTSTISMAIFNSFLFVYQRVYFNKHRRSDWLFQLDVLRSSNSNGRFRVRMLFNHQKRCHGQGCMRKNHIEHWGSNVIFNGEYIYIWIYHGDWDIQWGNYI